MKVTCEIVNIDAFKARNKKARSTAKSIYLANRGMQFMCSLQILYPDGISENELNDLLEFKRKWCFNLVGLDSKGYPQKTDAGLYISDWTLLKDKK